MEKIKDNLLSVILLIAIIGIIIYMFINQNKQNNNVTSNNDVETEYIMSPKTYGVNEYSKLYVSDAQMAAIYYNEYKNYLNDNLEKAYELVDNEYKKYKTKDFSSFKNYINSKKIKTGELKEYKVENNKEFVYYIVKDNKNNVLVFKTNGILQYTVYLDNETVVIE